MTHEYNYTKSTMKMSYRYWQSVDYKLVGTKNLYIGVCLNGSAGAMMCSMCCDV